MMDNLEDRKCVPCRGDTPTLTEDLIAEYLDVVEGWERKGETVEKTLIFKNFVKAMEFVTKVGAIAEEEGHHPDINIHDYKQVTFSFTTHVVHGLTLNDFVMAAKTDQLFGSTK